MSGPIEARNDSGYPVWLEGDEATNALCTVDYPHHAIHEGKAFSLDHEFSLATTASSYIHMVVATGYHPHFRIVGVASDSEKWKVLVYEMLTTVATHGAAVTFQNRNRSSAKTADTVLHSWSKSGSVNVATSALLSRHYIGGGTAVGGSKSGGSSATDEEYVLAPTKHYVVKALNGGTGSGICNVRMFFYDHAV